VSFVAEATKMDRKFTTLKKYSHKIGVNYWHVVLVTKYRYKMFGKYKQKNIVEACIRKMSSRHNIKIHNISVMPEHVHMLVTLPKVMTQSKAFQILKGGSAFLFFKAHPKSRLRLPKGNLWSAGGCAVTVGYNDLDTVVNYIVNENVHPAIA
jgi:putative transposase